VALAPQAGVRWVEQTPEPARFWIRWRPRGWPPPPHDWIDLAAGALGDPGPSGSALPGAGDASRPATAYERLDEPVEARRDVPAVAGGLAAPPSPPDDVVWLPPVPPALEPERLVLAEGLARSGVPVLVQVGGTGEVPAGSPPGSALAALAAVGAVVVFDPLTALIGSGFDAALAAVAAASKGVPGAAAVWPLVAGLSDAEDDAARAAEALAAAGLAAVQPLALRLTPVQRRRLAEGGGVAFDALFHRPVPGERPFARAAAAAGLAPFLPRPLPRPPLRGTETRRLAGLLALAGELWLRCGRAPEAGHALLRAARWADAAGYDLGALAREGNLGVVTALDGRSRELLAEAAGGAEPRLVRELLAEYAGAAAGAEAAGARRAAAEEV
jgi:hypothetical protein